MQIITQNDKCYPKLLRETYRPPKRLYALGNIEILNEPQIAIVGSRHATPIGLENASQFAFELSKNGLIVISGLALGIDGAAHQGALDAKVPTIAVLANGLDQIYPARHARLAEAIIRSGGVILSEWSPKTRPLPAYFPQRNRIISGMSLGTLIVEATLRSGSLITARLAMEQNREVFAVPGSINSPQSEGCHLLINQGAKLVTNVSAILQELPQEILKQVQDDGEEARDDRINVARIKAQPNTGKPEGLDPTHRHLLKCVDFSPTTVEQVTQRSGLERNEVNTVLLSLELKGYINKRMSGYLRVTS